MRIKFSSIVIGGHVNKGLVDITGNLNVFAGDEQLNAIEGTRWDEAGAVTGLGTPSNNNGLGITNGGVRLRGSPDTEVCVGR